MFIFYAYYAVFPFIVLLISDRRAKNAHIESKTLEYIL